MSLHTIRQFPFRPAATLAAVLVALITTPAMAQVASLTGLPTIIEHLPCTGDNAIRVRLSYASSRNTTVHVFAFTQPEEVYQQTLRNLARHFSDPSHLYCPESPWKGLP